MLIQITSLLCETNFSYHRKFGKKFFLKLAFSLFKKKKMEIRTQW